MATRQLLCIPQLWLRLDCFVTFDKSGAGQSVVYLQLIMSCSSVILQAGAAKVLELQSRKGGPLALSLPSIRDLIITQLLLSICRPSTPQLHN